MENGDRILLYTDGVIEAANAKDEFSGKQRLFSLVVKTADLSTSDAADEIVASCKIGPDAR